MAATSLNLSQRLLFPLVPQLTALRTAYVLERQYKVPLQRMDEKERRRKLRERHRVYRVVEWEEITAIPDIECVLTRHVDGIGVQGEVIKVKRSRFWSDLRPSGAAVYATPENIEYHATQAASRIKRTPNALQTYRTLCGMTLPIRMNPSVEWTLNQSHVQVAFRAVGVNIDHLESIILPDEPITNQTSEQSPFYIKVKVNDLDEAEVTCYICPYSTNTAIRDELPSPPQVPLFGDRSQVEQRLLEQDLYYGTAK